MEWEGQHITLLDIAETDSLPLGWEIETQFVDCLCWIKLGVST